MVWDGVTWDDFATIIVPGPMLIVYPFPPGKLFRINLDASALVVTVCVAIAAGSAWDSLYFTYLPMKGVGNYARSRWAGSGCFQDAARGDGGTSIGGDRDVVMSFEQSVRSTSVVSISIALAGRRASHFRIFTAHRCSTG
eukprot:COSAG04_NODE_10653_length_761_cov_0.898792_2_plen_139_part_01